MSEIPTADWTWINSAGSLSQFAQVLGRRSADWLLLQW